MEPERPIEKLLRAFAKKRREQSGAPMELHSSRRQQLQKEIERRTSAPSGGGWFSRFLIGFRPRLAFAICFVGLLIMGLMFLPNLKHPRPSRLASADMSRDKFVRAEKTAPVLQPPPVSAVAPAAGERRQATQEKRPAVSGSLSMAPTPPESASANRQLATPAAETPKRANVLNNEIAPTEASTGVTVASTPPASKETFTFKADDDSVAKSFVGAPALSKDAASRSLSAAPPMTHVFDSATNVTMFAANDEAAKKLNIQKQSVAVAPTGAAYFNRLKSEAPVAIQPVSQVFNRSDLLAARRRATETVNGSSPVLLSFRVEQTGNTMRVVDSDGSVYTGAVQVAQQASTTRATPPKNAPALAQAARTPAPSQAAQNYFFRVAGTNHNLKQNVIFSGNFVPLTNDSAVMGSGNIGGLGGATRVTELPTDLHLSNSQISGTAVIGDQKGIQVIATPAP
jgi:hypothetical protein